MAIPIVSFDSGYSGPLSCCNATTDLVLIVFCLCLRLCAFYQKKNQHTQKKKEDEERNIIMRIGKIIIKYTLVYRPGSLGEERYKTMTKVRIMKYTTRTAPWYLTFFF